MAHPKQPNCALAEEEEEEEASDGGWWWSQSWLVCSSCLCWPRREAKRETQSSGGAEWNEMNAQCTQQ